MTPKEAGSVLIAIGVIAASISAATGRYDRAAFIMTLAIFILECLKK